MDPVELQLALRDLRESSLDEYKLMVSDFLESQHIIGAAAKHRNVEEVPTLLADLKPLMIRSVECLIAELIKLQEESGGRLTTPEWTVWEFMGRSHSELQGMLVSAFSRSLDDWRKLDRMLEEFFLRLREEAIPALFEPLYAAVPNALARSLSVPPDYSLDTNLAQAVMPLMRSGSYQHAVDEGFKALTELVRSRSGLNLDGKKLMQEVFSHERPILRFSSLSTESERNEQKGLLSLLIGLYLGIRNPIAHTSGWIADPHTAFECIVMLNYCFKKANAAQKSPSSTG